MIPQQSSVEDYLKQVTKETRENCKGLKRQLRKLEEKLSSSEAAQKHLELDNSRLKGEAELLRVRLNAAEERLVQERAEKKKAMQEREDARKELREKQIELEIVMQEMQEVEQLRTLLLK